MADPLHEIRFPGETDAYRQQRNTLLQAELDLRTQLQKVADLRRVLPAGGEVKEDYVFERLNTTGDVEEVRLSGLFREGKDSLIIYSYMFSSAMENPCPMCTSILDSINGTVRHLEQRVNFAVVAKSPVRRIHAIAGERSWTNMELLSSEKNTYNADYFAELPDGGQWPACNVFVRREGRIHHFYSTELLYVKSGMQPRHVDLMWPLWNFLDLTPEGRGTDWYPRLKYD